MNCLVELGTSSSNTLLARTSNVRSSSTDHIQKQICIITTLPLQPWPGLGRFSFISIRVQWKIYIDICYGLLSRTFFVEHDTSVFAVVVE